LQRILKRRFFLAITALMAALAMIVATILQ
jgi:hypothetical protein